jgi:MSHA biogenesis protein MshQ
VAPITAVITNTWSVLDAAEASVTGNGTITTTTPLRLTLGFDAGAAWRFGVLRLIPAYGSELVDLPAQVEAQYWDGTRMATNSADQCTALPAQVAAMSNFVGRLSACETAIATAPATLVSGRTFLRLLKPGAGNAGSVDLALQLDPVASGSTCTAVGGATTAAVTANMPWLLGRWNGAAAYDQNPTTRATFSSYRSPYIYWRENF